MIHNLHRSDGTLLYVKDCATVSEAFQEAVQEGVNLTGLTLRGLSIEGVIIPQTVFDDVMFDRCVLDHVVFADSTTFNRCVFDQCTVANSTFKKCTFTSTGIFRTRMRTTSLEDAVMNDVRIVLSSTDAVNMKFARLSSCELRFNVLRANLDFAHLSDIKAKNCELIHSGTENALIEFANRSAVGLHGHAWQCAQPIDSASKASLFEDLQNKLNEVGHDPGTDIDSYTLLHELAFGSKPYLEQ